MKNKRTFTAVLAGILTASALLAGMVIPASAVAVAEVDPSTYVRIAQPVTNIIGDVAIVRDISSKEEMPTMTAFSTTPATAIYTLDGQLQALDEDGKPFATVEEIFRAHSQRILAVFRIDNRSEAEALVGYLDYRRFYDCMIITDDPEVMKFARTTAPTTFGVIDYTETYKNETSLSTEQCLDIRRSMKMNNGTMNPEYDVYNGEGVRALMIRGISVYPWTFYESLDEYKNHFLWGSAGLTGNDAHRLKRLTKDVFYDLENSELECGDTISLQMGVTLYQRLSVERNPSVVTILEGEDLVQVNGAEMTVVGEEGRVTFVLGYTNLALDYTVHTQPITFDIVSHEETTLPETQAPVTDQATSTEADAPTGGCKATVSSAALVIVAATAAWISRKKKDD